MTVMKMKVCPSMHPHMCHHRVRPHGHIRDPSASHDLTPSLPLCLSSASLCSALECPVDTAPGRSRRRSASSPASRALTPTPPPRKSRSPPLPLPLPPPLLPPPPPPPLPLHLSSTFLPPLRRETTQPLTRLLNPAADATPVQPPRDFSRCHLVPPRFLLSLFPGPPLLPQIPLCYCFTHPPPAPDRVQRPVHLGRDQAHPHRQRVPPRSRRDRLLNQRPTLFVTRCNIPTQSASSLSSSLACATPSPLPSPKRQRGRTKKAQSNNFRAERQHSAVTGAPLVQLY